MEIETKREETNVPSEEKTDGSAMSMCEKSELEELREKNASLMRELDERKKADERMRTETEEFSELFPDVSLDEVPSGIWDEVQKGIPLSAAYARHERKVKNAKSEIERTNGVFAEKSAGAINARGTENYYFSPSDVRKMSASEVKENYNVILNSMKHWN